MPRLFTGIELPAMHAQALGLLQNGPPGMRFVEPSDFHITLRFIGDVDRSTALAVLEALSSRQWEAPHIKLGEIAQFGGRKPSSIHAKVQHDERLSALAATHERLMQRIGLPPEGRKFSPHVTIARCRGMSAEQVARWLGSHGGLMLPSFTPSRFVLYSARDSKGGGPYRVEAGWEFEKEIEHAASHEQG